MTTEQESEAETTSCWFHDWWTRRLAKIVFKPCSAEFWVLSLTVQLPLWQVGSDEDEIESVVAVFVGLTTLTSGNFLSSSVQWTRSQALGRIYRPYCLTADYLEISDCCYMASPAVSEILGSKRIGVTSLIFGGHVTSSITWPFNSP